MRILVTGTFDDLHPGHAFVLNEAMKRGEVWVIVARDTNVENIKQRLPVQNEHERKRAIEDAFPNAHVILGDGENFLKPVHGIRPDLVLLGYDQALPPGVSPEDLGAPIERLPAFQPDVYKSSLRRKG